MENVISISTGLVYRFIEDNNEKIRKVSSFHPDGMELILVSAESVFNFKPDKNSLLVFHDLGFPTIHAPCGRGIRYSKNDDTPNLLKKIEFISDQLGAKNVTFHVNEVEDYSIFDGLDFQVSIENSDRRKPFGRTPAEIEKVLEKNKNIFFTFDIAHAMIVNPNSVSDFLKLSDRISEIHISVCSNELNEHHFIHLKDAGAFRDVVRKIPSDIPLVIESSATKIEDIDLITQEIDFLRSI